MTIQSETTVGQIATEYPSATRVFHRHGIDFCCGGGKPLSEACTAKGLDTSVVLAEIEKELAENPSHQDRWDEAPVTDLIDHILGDFHEPLREELPRLEQLAAKVLSVHGDKDPNLATINKVFGELKAELEQHMLKEEQILFPMIMQNSYASVDGPISVMEVEHDQAGAVLAQLRELTNDFTVPEEACNSWRALWHGLADFEKVMHQHIHLENNILFPRVQNM